jgi:hypothetical protein
MTTTTLSLLPMQPSRSFALDFHMHTHTYTYMRDSHSHNTVVLVISPADVDLADPNSLKLTQSIDLMRANWSTEAIVMTEGTPK